MAQHGLIPATDAAGSRNGAGVRRSDTRDRLLVAATELFGSRGFDATSMRDIATAVGVKAPAIYNHFASKEELLAEATTWMLQDFHQAVVGPDIAVLDAEQRLAGLVRRHVLYQLEHGSLVKANDLVMDADALRQVLPEHAHKEIRRLMRRYLDLLTDVISRIKVSDGVGPPTPRLYALAIVSLCDRVHTWYRPSGAYSPAQVAEYYWQLVHGMLRLPAAPAPPGDLELPT